GARDAALVEPRDQSAGVGANGRRYDVERGAARERREDLPDGDVEAGARPLARVRSFLERRARVEVVDERLDASVMADDALRPARRPRREQDVRDVVREA